MPVANTGPMLHLPADTSYQSCRMRLSHDDEAETNPHDGKSGVIRQHLNDHKLSEWGFVIVRCDYTSQPRWEKFLSFIREDSRVYLDWNHDLWDPMAWSVIEDQEGLDGADYEQASARFGKWVDEDIRRMHTAAEQKGVNEEGELDDPEDAGADLDIALQDEAEPRRSQGSSPDEDEDKDSDDVPPSMQHYNRSDLPRHQFFIYVDKAVIDNIVDIADPTTPRDIPRAYFVKVCCQHFIMERAERRRNQMIWKAKHARGEQLTVEEQEEADLDGWDPDDDDGESEEEDDEDQRACVQQFKAFEMIELSCTPPWSAI